jgi:CRP/FNR family transcriptional regulator, cyclic AMP receptor protein
MCSETPNWYLLDNIIFNQLKGLELDHLKSISHFKKMSKNEIIYFNEDPSLRIYLIINGTLKICHEDASGKEIISEMLTDGDVFGQLDFSENQKNNKKEYARVLSDGLKICYFEAEKFETALNDFPNLYKVYSSLLLNKLNSFQSKYKDLIFKSLETRIEEFFIRYAKHHAQNKNGKMVAEMMLTHQEIADYTAGSRQSVTTVINRMIDDGKIEYEGRKKVIFHFVV